MKRIRCLAVQLATLLAIGAVTHLGAAVQNSDPRATVRGTLDSLVDALKAKEYRRVITEFTNPDDLVIQSGSVDDAVASAERKGDFDRLLKSAQAAKQVEPTVSADGNVAVFTLPDGSGQETTFALKRKNGRWYIL